MQHLKQIEERKNLRIKKEIERQSQSDINGLDTNDRNMTDCLYNTLALTKAPEKLQDYIPSEYANIAKVLSKRGDAPPPVPSAPSAASGSHMMRHDLGPKPPERKESLAHHQPAPPVPTRRNKDPPPGTPGQISKL